MSLREYTLEVVAPGHWAPWGELEDAVRTGHPTAPRILGAPVWDHYADHPEEGEHFSLAMGELSAMASADVAAVVDVPPSATIVDVGRAHGALLTGLLEKAPDARGVLIDRPAVVEAARARLDRSGVGQRIEPVAGDFFEGVPAGDPYLLKQVLHDWDDERACDILAACRHTAHPESRVLVVE
jgi:hypothetical protein